MINIKTITKIKDIPATSILYLEGMGNYTQFHLKNGTKYLSSFTLKYLQDKKDTVQGFVRISRGCLLNPDHIVHIEPYGNTFEVTLTDGTTVTASRRKKAQLHHFFGSVN